MRLTSRQTRAIYTGVNYFGTDAQVWLFGSQVDDTTTDRDIDLYIEIPDKTSDEAIEAKLNFLRDLHLAIGEQKVDVALRRLNSLTELPIYAVAKQTGILLQ